MKGYRTGIIGKLNINPESTFPFDFWWNDRNYISYTHRDMQKATTMAEGFINASDAPFLLMVNYPDAHLPFLHQESGLPETPYTADPVETLPFIGIDTPRLRQHTADYYNCMGRLDARFRDAAGYPWPYRQSGRHLGYLHDRSWCPALDGQGHHLRRGLEGTLHCAVAGLGQRRTGS